MQFWTAESSELANAFTYGGSTLAQFPMTIYPVEAVKALTFIVPITFVNWYPSLYILDRDDPLGLPGAVQFAVAGRGRRPRRARGAGVARRRPPLPIDRELSMAS